MNANRDPQRLINCLPQCVWAIAILDLLLSSAVVVQADAGAMMGGGNFDNGRTGARVASQHQALRTIGAKKARFALHPAYYWVEGHTKETLHDAAVLQAHSYGVTPTFYFEHEGVWTNNLLGSNKWYDIGRNFALRFSPNSAWLTNQGIRNWGVTVFQAINEPDLTNQTPNKPGNTKWPPVPLTGTNSYFSALEGLADGVHSVDAKLAVVPGGWGRPCTYADYRCAGYAGAIAPLINSGKLAGIDLHTYNDILWAPILRKNGEPVSYFSLQHNFDQVKRANGITAECDFYSSEFNFKKDGQQDIDEALAAKRFLTCIWANLGVVKNDGVTWATKMAMTWNIFHTTASDDWYGICTQLSPKWLPTLRGQVLTNVIHLTSGMEFTSLSKSRGEFILAGNGRKLWVWQNYQNWSSVYGNSYTVSGIPAGATTLKVWGWNGLRQTIPLSGESSYTVTNLGANETYMFEVHHDKSVSGWNADKETSVTVTSSH